MIGTVYYGQSTLRQRYRWIAGSGIVLLGLGLVTFPWLMIVGMTLLCGGGLAALRPAPHFQVELRPEGLHYQPGDRFLPYPAIVAVCALRKNSDQAGQKPTPLDVCTADEGIRIPPHAAVPAFALEEFLISRASPFITPPADADVAKFYDQECAKYGPDQVALFHGRTANITVSVSRHLRWFACGWLFGALASLSLAFNVYSRVDSVSAASAAMIGLGFVLLLVSFLVNPRQGLKKQAQHVDDVLVVGPSGLALRQAKLKGKLRWDEVRNIALKPAAASASTGSLSTGAFGQQSLHLQVAGAVIVLVEVYDRSLTRIKQTIEQHCYKDRHRLPSDPR
jgi:hypothetical protein